MGKSAPSPPDPHDTAAASTSTNIGTAVANAFMNNANQVGPDGSITYSQTGNHNWTDSYTGKSYDIPTFTATQTLSPTNQAIKDQTDATKLNLGQLANDQSGFLKNYMATPFDGSNDATEARLMQLGRARLDPIIAQQHAGLQAQLADQGIQLGSAAYDRAMMDQSKSDNDAYNQLILQGHGQAFQEAQAIRNQPINEITALLSGSQVNGQQPANFNQSTIPTTDVAGLINENYNQRLGAYQMQQAQTQSLLGGLFGLGSAGIFKYSDRRLKTDISKVGKTDDGQNIYAYRYKAGGPMQLGLMADEVEEKHPDAVRQFGRFKAVDYGKAMHLGA